ncbi:MAG: diaminopimelate dehydrogenase, partial [Eggerthellaceae bacterium]
PLTEGVPVFAADEMASHRDNIDVLVLCGGSANDLPEQTPACANLFNVVDSFDTHANIPAHFAKVDAAAQESGNVAVISAGWDPGMFSIARLYAQRAARGETTFWGRGARRVTATPFVASRAWPMRASTPCPSPRRSAVRNGGRS